MTLQDRAIEAALSGLSENTRACYASRLRHWLCWHNDQPFDRESVQRYLRHLEVGTNASAQVRNQTLAAIKRLAREASELAWIDYQTAQQIQSIRVKQTVGIRTGKWLSAAQVVALLNAPDRTTIQGKRDACVLALLAGCGLRRNEACELKVGQVKFAQKGANQS